MEAAPSDVSHEARWVLPCGCESSWPEVLSTLRRDSELKEGRRLAKEAGEEKRRLAAERRREREEAKEMKEGERELKEKEREEMKEKEMGRRLHRRRRGCCCEGEGCGRGDGGGDTCG